MAIFQVKPTGLEAVSETTFGAEGIFERKHIQKLLREQIAVLDDTLLVIAEEFGDWLDSSRRIDLLCLDRSARLVVVELKRTEDGGHMELQALRYAAMVSTMTFDQVVDTLARTRNRTDPDPEAARKEVLGFLGWTDVDEDEFAQDTRIVLAAADFGKELTTSVIWLNERGLSVRCVRLKPYRMQDGTLLLDVQQIIPLPEATEFQTQIGVKKQAERKSRTDRDDLRHRFWEALLAHARTRTDIHANRSATEAGWVSGGIGRRGFSLIYATRQRDSQVELWISFGVGQSMRNKAAFKALDDQRVAVERDFGGSLEWQELPEGDGCRVRFVLEGGYRSPQEQWPTIHAGLADAMIRLDRAMRHRVAALSP
jgi:Domain of unknown function (DUF4268)